MVGKEWFLGEVSYAIETKFLSLGLPWVNEEDWGRGKGQLFVGFIDEAFLSNAPTLF